jgi:TRAP-type C4-dicarboxylate transport system permease small subunit
VKTAISAYNFLIVALAVLAGGTIGLAFVMVVADVSMRSIGLQPPAHTVAVVEYILLYFTLFSAPYLVRTKGHVYIDVVTMRLPAPARRLVEKFAYLICILGSLTFAYISWNLLIDAFHSHSFDERSIDIPTWLLYLPMPLSFFLVATEFVRYLLGFDTYYALRDKPDTL